MSWNDSSAVPVDGRLQVLGTEYYSELRARLKNIIGGVLRGQCTVIKFNTSPHV